MHCCQYPLKYCDIQTQSQLLSFIILGGCVDKEIVFKTNNSYLILLWMQILKLFRKQKQVFETNNVVLLFKEVQNKNPHQLYSKMRATKLFSKTVFLFQIGATQFSVSLT